MPCKKTMVFGPWPVARYSQATPSTADGAGWITCPEGLQGCNFLRRRLGIDLLESRMGYRPEIDDHNHQVYQERDQPFELHVFLGVELVGFILIRQRTAGPAAPGKPAEIHFPN